MADDEWKKGELMEIDEGMEKKNYGRMAKEHRDGCSSSSTTVWLFKSQALAHIKHLFLTRSP